MQIRDVIKFNLHRRFIDIGKEVLEEVEKTHIRIKELEQILIKMGLNVEMYENSPFDYKKSRSKILSKINDASRECQTLIDGFEISLKKEDK